MVSEFETLLLLNLKSLERFVNYKVNNREDAQDIIQEACLIASQKFDTLRDKALFKAWLIRIANNKCVDYYRRKSKIETISFENVSDAELQIEKKTENAVVETIDLLPETDKRILYLYYFYDLSQKEIANTLKIPIGTVKSRLHYAKEKFKELYPDPPKFIGDDIMKNLPKVLPEYKIEKSEKQPFSVKCEELVGWQIIPRLNEELSVGLYYMPGRELNEYL